MPGIVRFRVLGPVTIEVDGRSAALQGGRRCRALLLALILDVGHAVPVDRIITDVWPDRPPPSAEGVVHSNVSRLRKVVGRDVLRAIDHSYVLDADPLAIDAVEFERLVDRAGRLLAEGDAAGAAECCRAALRLWQGPVFGDLGDEEFATLEAQRLVELRTRAIEIHFTCEIALGEAGQVIGRLRADAEAHRYRERLWALLMTALAQEGRRVEAVRAYDEAREMLAEIGLEPCAELRELADRVVQEAPGLEAHLLEEGTGRYPPP